MKIPLSNIVVGERQRTDLGNIDQLAKSMKELGLIQPIAVRQHGNDWLLVAGRRRLEAAKQLGWPDIEAYDHEHLTDSQHQLMELEEDVRRKGRTWKELCLSTAKIHYLKTLEKADNAENWTSEMLAEFSGHGVSSVRYMLRIAKILKEDPEGFVAQAENFTDAIKRLDVEEYKAINAELERRRSEAVATDGVAALLPQAQPAGNGQLLTLTSEQVTLVERANYYNNEYPHLPPLVVHDDSFLYGYWFLGGASQDSEFYGSYSVEYLARVQSLFPDAKKVVHLFAGAMPPGPYVRVGLDPSGTHKPDIVGNAEELSSFLPFKPDLIYADPPYSQEDAEHYKISLVNRAKVVDECATILEPGGYLVWLDQALPVFGNDRIHMVGVISYIRSTGNRFRCVVLFQKPY